MTNVLTIYVMPTPNCINTVRYLTKNIHMIKQMGIRIIVRKFTEDDFDPKTVEVLRSRKINKFPALITNGKVIMGFQKIEDLFNKNIKEYKNMIYDNQTKNNHGMNNVSCPRSLDEYHNKVIFAGDDDDSEDENENIRKEIDTKLKMAIDGRRNGNNPLNEISNVNGPISAHKTEVLIRNPSEIPGGIKDNIVMEDNFKLLKTNKNSGKSMSQDDEMEQAWLNNHFGTNDI